MKRWWPVVLILILGLGVAAWQGRGSVRAPAGRTPLPASNQVAFTMGTVARLTVLGDKADAAAAEALQELDRLSGLFDRFEAGTDVANINAAQGEWVTVHPDTYALLEEAIRWSEASGGAFDPTVAPLVDLWGLVEAPEPAGRGDSPTPLVGIVPPAAQEVAAALEHVDWRQIEFGSEGRVRLSNPQAQVDLGGVAKGYAADRAASRLAAHGIEHALIDLGGDLYALGTREDGTPWRIGVVHPRDPNQIIAVVPVADQGVVTSGDYERYFEYEGQRYSHLLNPHTGYPSGTWVSVTVVAPRGVIADAVSTGLFAMEPEAAFEWIESLPGIDAILIDSALEMHITSGLAQKVERR